MAAKGIEHLADFIDVAQMEFYIEHPQIYAQFVTFLGRRIEQVNRGELSEQTYIGQRNIKANELAKRGSGLLDGS